LLPKAWGEWALSERPDLTADLIRKEAEKFKDHWIANSNQAKSKKADWEATWRNWIRNVSKGALPNAPQKTQSIHDKRSATAKAMFGDITNANDNTRPIIDVSDYTTEPDRPLISANG
jgi:hypothetical protein